MLLSKADFGHAVACTPLVSIDLIVRDSAQRVLIGKRNNRPAQGYWFVPGGRILKDETRDSAFVRLTQTELGQSFSLAQARFLDVYEHFYADNFSGTGFSTHYVVLAYQLNLDSMPALPLDQHSDYRWSTVPELLSDDQVHDHTKAYFTAHAPS